MKERNTSSDKEQLDDSNIEQRKTDHIELAFKSSVEKKSLDHRFIYEPMLSAHAKPSQRLKFKFGNKTLNYPIWVSSMTGGTEKASTINNLLASVCNEFGLGMGLGSCRQLLDSDEKLPDFNVRHKIGDQPLFANLGIAQLEQIISTGSIEPIELLVDKLKADGLFVHINPLQEWMQPEGDHIKKPAIETIKELLDKTNIPIIIKEVGQGMGKESLRALLKLPILAIEFGANGGTNFSKLEMLRASQFRKEVFSDVASLGHSAEQMVGWCNQLYHEMGEERKCNTLIISGGIKSFLDGYYLIEKSRIPAIYAQAAGFLKYAIQDYEALREYVKAQIEGLLMAKTFLKLNED